MKISNETKIALFAIAALAVGVWGFKFLKGINILTSSRIFYVRYANVDQLLVSSPVLVNGLQVGTVKNLQVDKEDDKTIIATLNIDADVDIHKDALAEIRTASVMGGKVVELISPGPCNGPDCAEDGAFLKPSSKSFLQTVIGNPEELDLYTERLLKGVTSIYDSIADPRDPQGLGRSLVALERSLINLEGLTSRLNRALDASSAGISATANINPGKIAETIKAYGTPEGDRLQAWINEVRGVMQGYVMIPALKYVIAHYGSDPHWNPVRPPLVEIDEKTGRDMIEKLDKLGFTMPGLKQAMAVAAE